MDYFENRSQNSSAIDNHPIRAMQAPKSGTAILRTMKSLSRIVWLARVSIFMTILGVIALLVPDQTADALKDLLDRSLLQLSAFGLSALFAVGAVAIFGHRMIVRIAPELSHDPGMSGWAASRLPLGLGLLLTTTIAIALIKSVHSKPFEIADRILWDAAIIVSAFVIAGAIARLCWHPSEGKIAAIGVVSAIILLLVFSFFPVAPAAWLGSPTILLLWIGSMVAVGSTIAHLLAPVRIPIFFALAAAALLFSYLDLNDNHVVRHEFRTDFTRGAHLSSYEFREWLKSRSDKNLYEGRNYPVFIVSAEGGGIRAAYFTALVLSSIQDRCPAFAKHIFAISGVSGGSLGAAVFAASVKHMGSRRTSDSCSLESDREGEFQLTAEAVLKNDFLSPLLAALLFPDLLQRILPWPVESLDRARAFEFALEEAWKDETNGKEFSQSFFDLSAGWRDQSVPALVLNTTNVETGMRMAISHLDIYQENDSPLETLFDVNAQLTMPLSTAVGLSARFPLVAPAGRIPTTREPSPDQSRRYVDGGYFENSGTATVWDLLTAVRSISSGASYNVDLYVLRIGSEAALPQYNGRGFGELLSPAKTLLNAREARGTVAKAQLLTTMMEFGRIVRLGGRDQDSGIIEFELRQRSVPLPLGWALSEGARNEIASQLQDCDAMGSTNADTVCNLDSRAVILKLLQPSNATKQK